VAQQGFAGAGQADAARLAQQQCGADRLFQQAHAVAGRRRRQMHALGATGQVPGFGNRDEEAQVGQVIVHSVGQIRTMACQ
jgi:hypothetical protein